MKKIIPLIVILLILAAFGGYKIYWDKEAEKIKTVVKSNLDSTPNLTYNTIEAVGFPTDLRITVDNIELDYDATALLKEIARNQSRQFSATPAIEPKPWHMNIQFKKIELSSNLKGSKITAAFHDAITLEEKYDGSPRIFTSKLDKPLVASLDFAALKDLTVAFQETQATPEKSQERRKAYAALEDKIEDAFEQNPFTFSLSSGKRVTTDSATDKEFSSLGAGKLLFHLDQPNKKFKFTAYISDLIYSAAVDEYLRNHPLLRSMGTMALWGNDLSSMGNTNMNIDLSGTFNKQEKMLINIGAFNIDNSLYNTEYSGKFDIDGNITQRDFKGDFKLVGKTDYHEAWYNAALQQLKSMPDTMGEILKQQGAGRYASADYQRFVNHLLNTFAQSPEKFIPRWHEHGTSHFDFDMNVTPAEGGMPQVKLTNFMIKDDKYGITIKQPDASQNLAETKLIDIEITNYASLIDDLIGYYRNIHPLLESIDPMYYFDLPSTLEQKTAGLLKALSNDPTADSNDIVITIDGNNQQVGTLNGMEVMQIATQTFAEEIQLIQEKQRSMLQQQMSRQPRTSAAPQRNVKPRVSRRTPQLDDVPPPPPSAR